MFDVQVVDDWVVGLEGMFYVYVVGDFVYGESVVQVMVVFGDNDVFEGLQMLMVVFFYFDLDDYGIVGGECWDFFVYLFSFDLLNDFVGYVVFLRLVIGQLLIC